MDYIDPQSNSKLYPCLPKGVATSAKLADVQSEREKEYLRNVIFKMKRSNENRKNFGEHFDGLTQSIRDVPKIPSTEEEENPYMKRVAAKVNRNKAKLKSLGLDSSNKVTTAEGTKN